jgi:hypothetical protein
VCTSLSLSLSLSLSVPGLADALFSPFSRAGGTGCEGEGRRRAGNVFEIARQIRRQAAAVGLEWSDGVGVFFGGGGGGENALRYRGARGEGSLTPKPRTKALTLKPRTKALTPKPTGKKM